VSRWSPFEGLSVDRGGGRFGWHLFVWSYCLEFEMSDVEKYWDALRAKWPRPVPAFKDLHPMHQQQVIMSINLLLEVLDNV
jgi:hypothetical protein